MLGLAWQVGAVHIGTNDNRKNREMGINFFWKLDGGTLGVTINMKNTVNVICRMCNLVVQITERLNK